MTKRELVDSDTQNSSATNGKRHKACRDNARAPCLSRPPTSLSAQSSQLTEAALGTLQRSLAVDDNLEKMAAALPTPRSTCSHDRGRTRRTVRSYRSRTPSPRKKSTPQTYRSRNMHHANVFVETLPSLPSTIDTTLRQILAVRSWDEQRAEYEQHLETVADWYQIESQKKYTRRLDRG